MSELSESEKAVLLKLVEQASETMGNAGCNDFDLSEFMVEEQIDGLAKEYHQWNGDPEEFDPKADNSMAVPDFALITYLTKKALGLLSKKRS